MKVLFLDHYGVLCLGKPGIVRSETSEPTADEFFDTGITVFSDFDTHAVSTLNSLLDSVDFEIVISSDWKRHATLDGMCEFYQRQGIKKMPLAYTDWLPGYPTYHEQRATEINTWLDQHPETTHWAAVDDLYMGTWLSNFVWAKNVHQGLTDFEVKKQILTHLT